MKVTIEPYNPNWTKLFELEKVRIANALLQFHPSIDHIGSTSVEGLAAKPIIDILVGLEHEGQLDDTISHMMQSGFMYLKKFEKGMEYRRFFVIAESLTGKPIPHYVGEEDDIYFGVDFQTLTHVHIMVKGTYHWQRHIAFRNYLREHPVIRMEYETLKKQIAQLEFKDMLEYNHYKEDFILEHQQKALEWFNSKL